ncbi:hypothetical protein DL546_005802 [Coniochaeta pulveracea]|uniref:Uncharacterized protein n=1 Tax=Coniochaeta pulveracea TaxID=177199 RepID=A0A420YIT1_9PEZI|nr:hypothetical protein DL546_005802 [Coniochaeta pulveracea]
MLFCWQRNRIWLLKLEIQLTEGSTSQLVLLRYDSYGQCGTIMQTKARLPVKNSINGLAPAQTWCRRTFRLLVLVDIMSSCSYQMMCNQTLQSRNANKAQETMQANTSCVAVTETLQMPVV